MFVQIQIPVWDQRRATNEAAHVLQAPGWPAPRPGRSFLHGVGGVVRRQGGGLSDWVGEDVYCDLSSRLRIHRRVVRDVGDLKAVSVRHIFSRFYFDGTLSGKIDIGFVVPNPAAAGFLRLKSNRWGLDEPAQNSINLGTLLRTIVNAGVSLLDIPARVVGGDPGDGQKPLHELLRPLVRRLVYGSTLRGARGGTDQALASLRIGPPSLCVECTGAVGSALSAAARRQDAGGTVATSSVALGYATRGADECPVWVLFQPDPRSADQHQLLPPNQRLLRIALLRLSSDLWGLRQLIRLLGHEKLDLEPRSDAAQLLQEYVRQLSRRLRSDLKEIYRTEAGRIAQPIFKNLFQAGAVESAFSRLSTLDTRPNVRAVLRDVIDSLLDRGTGKTVTIGPGGVYVEGTVGNDVRTNVTVQQA